MNTFISLMMKTCTVSPKGYQIPSFIQCMQFSKYISKSHAKRLPLTTKRAGKGYYKGNRCKKEGVIDSKGRFTRVPELCTELVVPDLTNFKLKAYVASGAKKHVRKMNAT